MICNTDVLNELYIFSILWPQELTDNVPVLFHLTHKYMQRSDLAPHSETSGHILRTTQPHKQRVLGVLLWCKTAGTLNSLLTGSSAEV